MQRSYLSFLGSNLRQQLYLLQLSQTFLLPYTVHGDCVVDDSFKGKAVNDNPKDLVYPITPKLISREKLYEALAYKEQRGHYNMYGLKSIFNKIDLIDRMRF